MRWSALVGVGFLSVALLVGSSDGQVGEPKKTKDGKVTGQLPQGWKELNLTAVQKEKVYDLDAKYKAKLETLAEQIEALKAEQKAERFKILTVEQKEKLIKSISGEAPRKEAVKVKDKK